MLKNIFVILITIIVLSGCIIDSRVSKCSNSVDLFCSQSQQGSDKTVDEKIPCNKDEDCLPVNMHKLCPSGNIALPHCMNEYTCGKDGFCKVCHCNP
jgi:hypothetical protein